MQGDFRCIIICVNSMFQVYSPIYIYCNRSEFAGEQVPTLYEALDVCKKLNLLMFLELKEDAEKVSILFLCRCVDQGLVS